MTQFILPAIGKLDRELFEEIIFPKLGREDPRVIVKPRHGVDAGVLDLGDRIMVVAEDPTFGMPVLLPNFGWSIVHICASDVCVLGVKPEFMTISLLLPPGSRAEEFSCLWNQIDMECKKLGISIVGGHTGVYPGIAYPLNGGCTVWGFGRKEDLTPPSNAQVGDKVIITKGPAIEATGILALQAEAELKLKLGEGIVERGKELFFQMTVVQDALTAHPFAHAMHDATEGGLLNGLFEVAQASGKGIRIWEELIPIPEEVAAICWYFDIDPLIAISEGTLIITAPEENVSPLLNALAEKNISAYVIGEIEKEARVFIQKNGQKRDLTPVKVDPFWDAYFRTLEKR